MSIHGIKVADAGYYNKILFIAKHRNMRDVSVQFINSYITF